MAKDKGKSLYLIPILSKAFDILELLEQSQTPVSLEETFRNTKISKTTVYRILKTMVHRGYVAQTQDGLYRLVSRPRRLRFGFAVQSMEMPFSQAIAKSVEEAAAASGVEVFLLDNCYDSETAIRNAEKCIAERVDLMLEFQSEEVVAPQIAHILQKADIPLIAIDVPHPNSTYFGVDNFACGHEAGLLLAQYAQRKWKGRADWVVGVGFSEAGSYVQSRIYGAFHAVQQELNHADRDRYVLLDGRGLRDHSSKAFAEFLRDRAKGQKVLIAASNDMSALGVLDVIRSTGREKDCALVGQDCIPEVIEEMHRAEFPLIGSVSHESASYGPRLIQLGIAILRGHSVAPYNYVRHRMVTPTVAVSE